MKSIISFLALAVCAMLVIFSGECMEAARRGVDIWWNTLLPTLFPFFVCATLIEKSGALDKLAGLFSPVSRRLKLSYYALPLLLLGGMTGYPSAARLSGMLESSNSISEHEAQKLSTVCNLASPMFLSGAVAAGMFKNPSLFKILAISHYGVGLIIALAIFILSPARPSKHPKAHVQDNLSLGRLLPQTLSSCMSDITRVGGSVIFFLVLAELLCQSGLVEILGAPLELLFGSSAKNAEVGIILGIFEITGGISIIASEKVAYSMALPMSAFLISFGGLSVMVQAMGFTRFDSPYKYILTKLAHGLLSALVAYALILFLPGESEVFASSSQEYVSNTVSALATLFACSVGVLSAILLSIIIGKRRSRP